MGLSIRAQGLSLLLACALGGALGLVYDLFRPLRRRRGDTLWDLLFCLIAACAAFLFAMRAERGVLGTGELLLTLLGLGLYFRALSPLLLPILEKIGSKIGVICLNAQVSMKKVRFRAKKLFQNRHG